jgi:hypothetical protein
VTEVRALADFGALLEASSLDELRVVAVESMLLRETFDRSTAHGAFALAAERRGYEVVSSDGSRTMARLGRKGTSRLNLHLRRMSGPHAASIWEPEDS